MDYDRTRRKRQRKAAVKPARCRALRPDAPVVPRDDVLAQGQADAVAARLRRTMAAEQAVESSSRTPGPIVDDVKLGSAIASACGERDGKSGLLRFGQRVDGIEGQIEYHLADQHAFATNRQWRGHCSMFTFTLSRSSRAQLNEVRDLREHVAQIGLHLRARRSTSPTTWPADAKRPPAHRNSPTAPTTGSNWRRPSAVRSARAFSTTRPMKSGNRSSPATPSHPNKSACCACRRRRSPVKVQTS